MAGSTRLTLSKKQSALVRLPRTGFSQLQAALFRRYPDLEWATFARFGWRETGSVLVLTMAALDPPKLGDLDDNVGHVAIQEPYTLRIALAAEKHRLGVAIVHSHPEGCPPRASSVDDDMDSYYADYFSWFAPNRPYISLIVSRVDGAITISGRVYWRGNWINVHQVIVEATPIETWPRGDRPSQGQSSLERHARLASALGHEATTRLRRATVAVIGAGGTGSAAVEVLARAGVGRLVIVDPDVVEPSNLERLHGAIEFDAEMAVAKALVAKRHVASIDKECEVVAIKGRLPQSDVIDAVISADAMVGCTDQHYSRLALSDIASRYVVPAIDCSVRLEGADGRVGGQVLQLVRFLSDDACALCREMTLPQRVSQELMSLEEVARRKAGAARAAALGEQVDPYWQAAPQLNTVGYLTTIAGSMAAGYVIGWITGRFDPPFSRLQMNIGAPFFDVTDATTRPRPQCACSRMRGSADQGRADALIDAPEHWPPAVFL